MTCGVLAMVGAGGNQESNQGAVLTVRANHNWRSLMQSVFWRQLLVVLGD